MTVTSEAPLNDRDAAATDPPARARIRPTAPIDRPVAPPPPSFDGMYFRDYGSHPFVDPSEDPLSTFGLDVDTGSYTVGRRYLSLGELPPPASVRVEEWVNFFDYGDSPPHRGDFALTVEGARIPDDTGDDAGASYLVRVGVKAREVAPADRRSAVLVLLVDTSGSMARENRLGLARQSLAMMLDELRDDDEVALVTYGAQARVVLPPTRDKLAVRRGLDALHASGSTNLEHGMALAYELLARNHRPEALHRVVLLSDGVANVGLTDPELLLRSVAEHAARGVELLAVGVGMGNYNDALLERLADRGDGAYAYVDSLQEARRVFVDELVGTLQSVAGDARIQVAFDPGMVASYRLVGYANRDLPDAAFRDPRTDAGEVGSGHRVSALYEVALRAEAPRNARLGRVALRWRSRRTGEFEETSASIDRWRLAQSFERSAPSLRLAATVAEFAEVLRAFEPAAGAASAGAPHLDRLFRRAQTLLPELPGRSDVAELVNLIGRARDVAAERE
jgi:Ca-activated chloride channel family protein